MMGRPVSIHSAAMRSAVRVVLAVQATLLLALLLVVLMLAWSSPAKAQPTEASRHMPTLKREAQRVWGLGAPVATFGAQVHQESRWRADARSPVGAQGLAQFMPATAQWIGGLDAGLAERATFNAAWSMRALVVYDHWLHERIRTAADGCQRMAFTLSAYNGGLGWVYKRQAMARLGGVDPGVCLGAACTLNPGVSLGSQRENEHYPRAIVALERQYTRWGRGACTV